MANIAVFMNETSGYEDKAEVVGSRFSMYTYLGTPSGKGDKLVRPGARFFRKKARKGAQWDYCGDIFACRIDGKDATGRNIFKIVVEKKPAAVATFRIKTDACSVFGWKPLNKFNRTQGIIANMLLDEDPCNVD